MRYLATGSFIHVSGDLCSIPYSTSWRSIHEVMRCICAQRNKFIKFPSDLSRIASQFQEKRNITDTIGCIDGTHIPIYVPKTNVSETFRNRKGYFSLNVQMVCGPNNIVYDIDASWQGSAHDSTIWTSSPLYSRFLAGEFGEYHLLGDSAYPLSKFVITPFRNGIGRKGIFNCSR